MKMEYYYDVKIRTYGGEVTVNQQHTAYGVSSRHRTGNVRNTVSPPYAPWFELLPLLLLELDP